MSAKNAYALRNLSVMRFVERSSSQIHATRERLEARAVHDDFRYPEPLRAVPR